MATFVFLLSELWRVCLVGHLFCGLISPTGGSRPSRKPWFWSQTWTSRSEVVQQSGACWTTTVKPWLTDLVPGRAPPTAFGWTLKNRILFLLMFFFFFLSTSDGNWRSPSPREVAVYHSQKWVKVQVQRRVCGSKRQHVPETFGSLEVVISFQSSGLKRAEFKWN